MIPMLWAQRSSVEDEVAALALKRWTWSQILTSPSPTPSNLGLWTWLFGLLALLIIASVAQGPSKAFGQVLDLPGHVRLLSASLTRLKYSSRLVMILFGITVLSWTISMGTRLGRESALAEVLLLKGTKSVTEIALEEGVLAALTPVRDLFRLSDILLLLGVSAAIVFKGSADRWGAFDMGQRRNAPTGSLPSWSTYCWAAASFYLLYRSISLIDVSSDLPMESCLIIDIVLIPILMATCDGLLAAWVFTELRRFESMVETRIVDLPVVLRLMPAATLAAVAALPARYLSLMAFLALEYAPTGAAPVFAFLLRGPGLIILQGIAIATVGIAGAAPWCRGTMGSALDGYGRLLKYNGGRLLATIGLGGLAAGIATGITKWLLLSLEPQSWVLMAADSYTHYATLFVGLITLSALIELGSQTVEVAAKAVPTLPEEITVAAESRS